MKQYLELLEKITNEGVEKQGARANMPNTIGISKATIAMDMSDGFPLLTTKKMYFDGIVTELLWFLKGDTNIKYLVDNNCNIWNDDAYRWYLQKRDSEKNVPHSLDKSMFLDIIRTGSYTINENGYTLGDLGKVYGSQWRNQNGVDQLREVYEGLKSNPFSRYHIIDGWNKADFPEMALPPCHLLYQFICRPLTTEDRVRLLDSIDDLIVVQPVDKESREMLEILDRYSIPKFILDLNMYQRSCDTVLGVPFNLASMALFLRIMANAVNMFPGVADWTGGDTHIYVNHLEVVEAQLGREPMELPELIIGKELHTFDDILSLKKEDFMLKNYQSHGTLKAELFTGLKK